jgi:pyruvate dehydrogenase E2 component (dihydrolipoamide acetyltransferase)
MPRLNATLEADVVKVWRNINIGLAVALDDGLIAPVVREADRKTMVEIGREIRDLSVRARQNKLLPDEVRGSTFTVSNLGSYRSVDFFNPIINQPEAAVLGTGRMRDAVVAAAGKPAVHAIMGLSLTCDHRIIDGAPAAEFLRILMDYLERPFSMLF